MPNMISNGPNKAEFTYNDPLCYSTFRENGPT